MNEIVVAEVNSDVRRAVSVGAEENQVAAHEVGGGNRRAEIVLDVGGARNGNAGICEDVLDITRTVKAVGAGAAEDVGDADVIHRQRDNVARQVARAVSDIGHFLAEQCRVCCRSD